MMTVNPMNEPRLPLAKLLLSPKAAAAALSISERKLWSLTTSGDIPHVRIGRCVRYAVADLEQFIARQREGG